MITKVSLKGFQSHVNSEFNLDKGLNVITGPSDAGKTAIIRAVRWVAFNEPKGDAFVNESTGSAEVQIHLANKAIITKIRKSSKTTYLIQQDADDEGSLFEKSEVPAEVTNLLGIEKHSFGDFESALNFSFQLDAPFLISETASAGAKVLGKLAGTESVDLAIKGVSKDTYAARNLRTQAEKDMERITGSLFEYEGVDDDKQSLETAEMILEQVETNKEKYDDLKSCRHEFLLNRDKIQKLIDKLETLSQVEQLRDYLQEIEKSQQRYDYLLNLQSDGNRFEQRIDSLGQELEKYQEISTADSIIQTTESAGESLSTNILLRQSYQKYVDDVKLADKTLEKVKEIDTASSDIYEAEKDISNLNELRTLESEYRNMEDRFTAAKGQLDKFNDLQSAGEHISSLEISMVHFSTLRERQKSFITSNYQLEQAEIEHSTTSNNVKNFELELQQAWDEAGGVCPLCGNIVDENHAH